MDPSTSRAQLDGLNASLRAAYVRHLTRALKERSVRVTDAEAFAAAIPDEIFAPWMDRGHREVITRMVERFPPDKLAAVAADGALEDDGFAVKLG